MFRVLPDSLGLGMLETQFTYSTADIERSQFYEPVHKVEPSLAPPSVVTMLVVAGDLYFLDAESVPSGTILSEHAALAQLAEGSYPNHDTAPPA